MRFRIVTNTSTTLNKFAVQKPYRSIFSPWNDLGIWEYEKDRNGDTRLFDTVDDADQYIESLRNPKLTVIKEVEI